LIRPAELRARHPRAWRATKWIVGLVLLAVAVQVVANTYDELRSAAEDLTRVHPGWVVLAALAEALSYLLYAGAQRLLLASAGRRVSLAPLTGITVAGQAASNVLPGGLAVSSVVMYRQLRRRRVSDALTGWMLVVISLLYGTALALLTLIGIQIAGHDNPIPGLRVFSLSVVGVLLVGLILLSVLRSRLAQLPVVARSETLQALVRRLQQVHISLPAVAGALVLLVGSWAADAVTLIMAFNGVGQQIPWHGLLLAYCAGQMAASLPITPGGIGIAEGSLTVALVAFGGAKTGTLAAVLLYRLVAYWGLLPVGGVAYLLLRRGERRLPADRVPGDRDSDRDAGQRQVGPMREVVAGPAPGVVAGPAPGVVAEPEREGAEEPT
jgi:hypothetical protein